jgi:hypothetical protein
MPLTLDYCHNPSPDLHLEDRAQGRRLFPSLINLGEQIQQDRLSRPRQMKPRHLKSAVHARAGSQNPPVASVRPRSQCLVLEYDLQRFPCHDSLDLGQSRCDRHGLLDRYIYIYILDIYIRYIY